MMAGIAVLAVGFAALPLPVAVAATSVTLVLGLLAGPLRIRTRKRFVTANLVTLSVLLVLTMPALNVALWIGRERVPVSFAVRTAAGEPIGDAVVRIIDPEGDANPVEAQTAADGRATLVCQFVATGRSGAFEDSGFLRFEPWWVEVSAPGFRTSRAAVAEYAGRGRDIHNATPPRIVIVLQPVNVPGGGPLGDLAGDYFRGDGEVAFSLTLGADGQFSSVGRHSYAVFDQREGSVRVVDECLVLSLTVPVVTEGHPRFYLATELCPIPWGKRLYLVPRGEMSGFRDAIRLRAEPRGQPHGDYFLREGDWAKAVDGDPVFPDDRGSNAVPHDRDTAVGPVREHSKE
jgi:hypothetical protein